MTPSDPLLEDDARPRATCPGCGWNFAVAEVRAIAEGDGLPEDPVLGRGERLRFSPSRFDVAGVPLDPTGTPSPRLACPRCRGEVEPALVSSALSKRHEG